MTTLLDKWEQIRISLSRAPNSYEKKNIETEKKRGKNRTFNENNTYTCVPDALTAIHIT